MGFSDKKHCGIHGEKIEFTGDCKSKNNPTPPGSHLMGPDVYVMSLRKRAVPMTAPNKAANTTNNTLVDWECACGTVNSGKFCSECGKPRI